MNFAISGSKLWIKTDYTFLIFKLGEWLSARLRFDFTGEKINETGKKLTSKIEFCNFSKIEKRYTEPFITANCHKFVVISCETKNVICALILFTQQTVKASCVVEKATN